MERLIKILSHKRPAGGPTEAALKVELFKDYAHTVNHGNVVIEVRTAGGERSTSLFSCHTDSVHSTGGIQALAYDEEMGAIMLDNPSKPEPMAIWQPGTIYTPRARECLGADDGAGMWLMLEMIDAGVPGTYVFHHSEECGGLGSRALSFETEFLSQFKRAVAFDRRGTGDVINNQRGGRCCSDEFALALSGALNDVGMDYKPASGIFTDTANYISTIPECTNLSCGYYNEHTEKEWLDVNHLTKLRAALVKIDWEALPTARDPKAKPVYVAPKWSSGWDFDDDLSFGSKPKATSFAKHIPATYEELYEMTFVQLAQEAWDDPDNIAELLFELLHSDDDEFELDEEVQHATHSQ